MITVSFLSYVRTTLVTRYADTMPQLTSSNRNCKSVVACILKSGAALIWHIAWGCHLICSYLRSHILSDAWGHCIGRSMQQAFTGSVMRTTRWQCSLAQSSEETHPKHEHSQKCSCFGWVSFAGRNCRRNWAIVKVHMTFNGGVPRGQGQWHPQLC